MEIIKKILKYTFKKTRRIFSIVFLEEFFNYHSFYKILETELCECDNILELGAGNSSYLRKLDKRFNIVGVDIYEKSLLSAKKDNVFDEILVEDVRNIREKIKYNSFDAVVAFDLIEHLPKEDGVKLISDMRNIAKKKVIIYTPNGYLPQEGTLDNPFQQHISGWEYDEMKNMGFKVYGVNGYKKLRGAHARPKIKPKEFGVFISNISWKFLQLMKIEEKSFAILCSLTKN